MHLLCVSPMFAYAPKHARTPCRACVVRRVGVEPPRPSFRYHHMSCLPSHPVREANLPSTWLGLGLPPGPWQTRDSLVAARCTSRCGVCDSGVLLDRLSGAARVPRGWSTRAVLVLRLPCSMLEHQPLRPALCGVAASWMRSSSAQSGLCCGPLPETRPTTN